MLLKVEATDAKLSNGIFGMSSRGVSFRGGWDGWSRITDVPSILLQQGPLERSPYCMVQMSKRVGSDLTTDGGHTLKRPFWKQLKLEQV
jgi:hypothetical protein